MWLTYPDVANLSGCVIEFGVLPFLAWRLCRPRDVPSLSALLALASWVMASGGSFVSGCAEPIRVESGLCQLGAYHTILMKVT